MENQNFEVGDFVKFTAPDAPKGLFQIVTKADYKHVWDMDRQVLIAYPLPQTLVAVRSIDCQMLEGQSIPVAPIHLRKA